MKKIICIIILVSVITVVSVFAQEAPIKNGLSIGGASLLGNAKAGNYGDFGFGIFENENFYMRNHITIGGGELNSRTDYFDLVEKLVFGSHMNVTENFAVRSYALLGFGFSMFGGEDKTDWSTGFILTPQTGLGIEFMLKPFYDVLRAAFFIETLSTIEIIVGDGNVALLDQKYPAFENTYVVISIGIRTYFK